MDIVYAAEQATAAEVLEAMADPPSYSTVRKLLTILVDKQQLKYRAIGNKYVYRPTKARSKAGRSAMKRVATTLNALDHRRHRDKYADQFNYVFNG